MEALYILIPLSIVLVVIIAGAFWWSSTSGQFEELDREGRRILDEDAGANPNELAGKETAASVRRKADAD